MYYINMRKTSLFLLSFLFLLFPLQANAVSFQSGKDLTLPQDKTFDESVFVAAETLTINSPINGDLYCAGRDVTINTTIAGDVICAAENIKVSGRIMGSLRAVAQNIDSDASVQSSVTLGAQTIKLLPATQVLGDFFAGAKIIDMSGLYSRDIAVGAQDLSYSASTLRNAVIAGEKFTVSDSGEISGNLDLYTNKDSSISIPDTAVIGETFRHEAPTSDYSESKETKSQSVVSWLTGRIWSILSFLIVGFILLRFLPGRTLESAKVMVARPFASLFSGFAILIFTPFVFLLALITMVGAPAAFLLLFAYIIGIMISSVISSLTVGRIIVNKFVNNDKFNTKYYHLLFGLPALWLVMGIPQFGWLIGFISLCLGLGSFFLSYLPSKESNKTK